MKKIVVTILALVLATAMIVPMALPASADPVLVGQIAADGRNSQFAGEVQAFSDGAAAGKWQWTFIQYPGIYVQFSSVRLTSLTFPADNVAVLSGTFACSVYPYNFMSLNGALMDLSFEITDVPGSAVHPVGILVPLGMQYPNVGNDLVNVYGPDRKLICCGQIDCCVQAQR